MQSSSCREQNIKDTIK